MPIKRGLTVASGSINTHQFLDDGTFIIGNTSGSVLNTTGSLLMDGTMKLRLSASGDNSVLFTETAPSGKLVLSLGAADSDGVATVGVVAADDISNAASISVRDNDSGGNTVTGVSTITIEGGTNITSSLGANGYFDVSLVAAPDIDGGTIDGATIGGASAGAGTFTTLTANDQLVVNAGATITGDTTNEITLAIAGVGSQTADMFKISDSDGNEDLSVDADGVTTARSLIATTADINAGTVDATIGATTPAAGTFTTLTANDQLVVAAGATITGDTANEVTLAVKGAGSQTANLLLVEQSDGTDKLTVSSAGVTTAASLVATTADINAGTVDAVIGGTTPAAGTFTTLTVNTSLDMTDGNISNGALGSFANLTASAGVSASYGLFSDLVVDNLDVMNINSVTVTENTLEVADKLIMIASGSAESSIANASGIQFGGVAAGENEMASILYANAGITTGNHSLNIGVSGSTSLSVGADLIQPTGSGLVSLGSSSKKFKDLHIGGTATVLTGTFTGANISYLASALDGNNQAITNINIDSGAVDGATIGANSAAAGTFTTLTANDQLVVAAGATITGDTTNEVTLAVKGVGSQTANLLLVEQNDGTDKLTVSAAGVTTAASLVATTADINAGTVDAVIGGTTPAAGTFTTLTANDQLVVAAGATITGDTTDEITLAVKGVGSQTANLLTVEQSDGTDKLTISAAGVTTAASLVATTADINAGTMDNVTIGGSTAAAATVTNLTAGSNALTHTASFASSMIKMPVINGASAGNVGLFDALALATDEGGEAISQDLYNGYMFYMSGTLNGGAGPVAQFYFDEPNKWYFYENGRWFPSPFFSE
tara:strand:+ start:91477 stop:93990 length:2514 start_codon:yes stop_codon:yes gene_type:complete